MKTLLATLSLIATAIPGPALAFEPTCAAVSPPPDTDGSPGFLNVREKPDAKATIYTKTNRGQILLVDVHPTMNLFKDWAYVYGTMTVDGEELRQPRGWVSKQFLTLVECPEEKKDAEWCRNHEHKHPKCIADPSKNVSLIIEPSKARSAQEISTQRTPTAPGLALGGHTVSDITCEPVPGTRSIDCHRTDYQTGPTTDGMPGWLTDGPGKKRVRR